MLSEVKLSHKDVYIRCRLAAHLQPFLNRQRKILIVNNRQPLNPDFGALVIKDNFTIAI
jgi:hypothetical protein